MHLGFNYPKRSVRALLANILIALPLIALPTAHVAAQVATFSSEAVSSEAVVSSQAFAVSQPTDTAISSLLVEGSTLESDGRWGDALAHYEEALREYPNDRTLEARFDQARLHYSLERRLGDRSFRGSVSTLSPQEALNLYSELLVKIGTHYFDTPPWQQLTYRGVGAIDIALADPAFRTRHAIRASDAQLEQLRREMRQTITRAEIRTRYDAATMAAEIARLAAFRAGLSQTATLMEMTAAAAEGLDNYSSFLTADQLRDVYSQIEGNFVGLGVELKPDDGALLIVHVIPGSPAERSGIRSGDRIVAVDGQATSELSTDEAAALLTGEEGSTVRVTMAREREATRTVQVRREHVDVPALEDVQLIDRTNGVAYIRIPAFQKTTAQDVEAALWKLHEQGMRSLIIDLRGNPGGLLTASVELADKFVASGGIVSTRGRSHAEDFDYRAQRAGTWRVPLVVLIDGDSASASEIFAAAIKDSARGKIVGSRSYGKGSVQGIFPLGFGGTGIRLTTAKFYSPLGRPISKFGVSPDIGTRPATLTTEGVAAAGENAQFVGFRGVDAAANGTAANDTAAGSAPAIEDSTLTTAIEVARNEPVPVL